MAAQELSIVENKINTISENQIALNLPQQPQFIDRSEDLLSQMNFIAMTNKSLLNLK